MGMACRGCEKKTKGTAYVVYEDIFDAKRAQEGLSGFNVQNRYLIVLYWNQKRQQQHLSMKDEEAKLRRVQEQHGVDGGATCPTEEAAELEHDGVFNTLHLLQHGASCALSI